MSYVNEFLSLRSASDILATVGNLGNKPEKEISEAWAIIRKLRRILLNPKNQNKYTLVDLCSGNGLVPVITSHLFKIKEAWAIDKLSRERNWANTNNFYYLEADIYNIDLSILTRPLIITSVHCCKNLAERVIQIYNETKSAEYLILMPCCQGSLNSQVLQFVKEQTNKDLAWTLKLVSLCKGDVKIYKDNHVLSPRNYIIVGKK